MPGGTSNYASHYSQPPRIIKAIYTSGDGCHLLLFCTQLRKRKSQANYEIILFSEQLLLDKIKELEIEEIKADADEDFDANGESNADLKVA